MNSETPSGDNTTTSSFLARFFSLDSLPRPLQQISFFYLVIWCLYSIAYSSTDTFLLLFFLDQWTYQEVSLIFSIQIITQILFDYPTGVLGDWLGQKLVLIFAFSLKILSLVFLVINPSFLYFILYGILSGLGNSQLSGALDSWFDNKYRDLSGGIDTNREIYTMFQARLYIVYILIAALTCFLSGLIAQNISRRFLFFIEMFFYFVIMLLVIWKIEHKKNPEIKNLSIQAYFDQFRNGLAFIFKRRDMFFIFIGIAFFETFLNQVWTKLIFIPFYKSYAITDANLGLLRWISLIIDIFLVSFLQRFPSKSKKPKLGFVVAEIGIICGLMVILGYIVIVPASPTFQISKFIGLILIGISLGIPYRLVYLYYSKVMVDLVPNEIRNSVYSLLPTLILLFSIPGTLIGGAVITSHYLVGGIIFVIFGVGCGIILQIIGFNYIRKETRPPNMISDQIPE
ncbi:MFS transporter [Candidatus Lokiarchaeum ossiferum]|uniref:MFS transporter n=1 Tax=Candidatus Lokiarchaeum ossiferum TaxID=2951803 RepID=UPI00352C8FFF